MNIKPCRKSTQLKCSNLLIGCGSIWFSTLIMTNLVLGCLCSNQFVLQMLVRSDFQDSIPTSNLSTRLYSRARAQVPSLRQPFIFSSPCPCLLSVSFNLSLYSCLLPMSFTFHGRGAVRYNFKNLGTNSINHLTFFLIIIYNYDFVVVRVKLMACDCDYLSFGHASCSTTQFGQLFLA